jgi:hypothetical protein
MDDVDYLDLVRTDAVDYNVIGMNNRFSRPVNASGSVKKWVFGQTLGASFDSG